MDVLGRSFQFRIAWIGFSTILLFAAVTFVIYNRSSDIPLVIHPISYSNVAVFEAALDNPDKIELRRVPDPARHVEILEAEGGNRPVLTVTPFANVLIAMERRPNLRVVGGAGLNGLSLVAREAKSLEDLEGKRIGTSRGDSLEVFAKEAMGQRPYTPVYFDDPFVAIEALKRNQIDAVTHVEPYATLLVKDGMTRISTSRDLWGDHPDSILMTTEESLRKFRPQLQGLISMLITAEKEARADPVRVAKRVAPFYSPLTVDDLRQILSFQQPQIDIRSFGTFFKERFRTLRELGYVNKAKFPEDQFDFSLLPLGSG
jgi:hypothetical protein